MNQEYREIEAKIAEYPICEYVFMKREELTFSPRVRMICEQECARYGHSWACPPAIGTIGECMERCRRFEEALLFTTAADVPDIADFPACLAARREHERISYEMDRHMRALFGETLTLTTGCMTCQTCTYPDAPCRHPEKRFATIESHGIMIMQTAADAGISYIADNQTVIYFTLILFHANAA